MLPVTPYPGPAEIDAMAAPPPHALLRRRTAPGLFLSLIFLIAFLPALWNLGYWDLSETSAQWALRSLAVRQGRVWNPNLGEAVGPPDVGMQPPLHAWVSALVFELTGPNELGAVLPSYLFGAGMVVMVYLLGELFLGPSVGLLASVLVGLNHKFLATMQKGDPTTMLLFWIVATLYFYGRHLKAEPDRFSLWVIPGGVCLAGALMTVGLVGLIVPVVLLLHTTYQALAVDRPLRSALRRLLVFWNFAPTMGLLSIGLIGAGLALPWHLGMHELYGHEFWRRLAWPIGRWARSAHVPGLYGLVGRLVPVYPAILAVGVYGWCRAIRRSLQAEEASELPLWPSSCAAFWLALGLLSLSVWPAQHDLLVLMLGVPLSLLAGEALVALNARRISLRTLLVLMVLTIACVVWWQTHAFQTACAAMVASLREWHVPSLHQAIVFHLFVDVVAGLSLSAWMLYRWALTRDRRQLMLLGVFFALVVVVTGAKGLREVSQVRRRGRDWKLIRRKLQAQYGHTAAPTIQSLGSGRPSAQMFFAVRAALGWCPVMHCRTVGELREALSRPGAHTVVVAGRLPSLPPEVLIPLGQRPHVLVPLYGGNSAALYGSPPPAVRAPPDQK